MLFAERLISIYIMAGFVKRFFEKVLKFSKELFEGNGRGGAGAFLCAGLCRRKWGRKPRNLLCRIFVVQSGRFGQGIWSNPVAGHGFFRKVDFTENPVVLS